MCDGSPIVLLQGAYRSYRTSMTFVKKTVNYVLHLTQCQKAERDQVHMYCSLSQK
jgi:hypothetical protein